jgi:FixJ family two-component response regulator
VASASWVEVPSTLGIWLNDCNVADAVTMMNNYNKKLVIAVVDDDPSVRAALCKLLRSNGWLVSAYSSAEDFLQASSPNATGCLILDIELPGISGLELQQRLSLSERRQVPIIFHTGRSDESAHTQAIQGGACAFFAKPVAPESLLWAVKYATQLAR